MQNKLIGSSNQKKSNTYEKNISIWSFVFLFSNFNMQPQFLQE